MKSFNDIRTAYLSYLEKNGHIIIPSSSLVPQNDPTTLFTGSGMQPLVPYLMGKEHPAGNRLVDSQKCFRSMDIEEVGDNRHTTFFEMLGNWSLGDYFKKEQLPFFFNFLTGEVGLDASKLYVTAFIGDEKNNVPRDTESSEIWKELFASKNIVAKVVDIGSEASGYEIGLQSGRIFYYDAKKNWWSRAGTPEKMPAGEIGGPDSEVFYDFAPDSAYAGGHANEGDDVKWGKECHPNCDCGRFLEIGNSVFMQYIKNPDGTFGLLPKQNVDFGGGLERIAAASYEDSDVFKIDVFSEAIQSIEISTSKKYSDNLKEFRIILDHVRAAVFLLSDGVKPSNSDQGYFVRRLLRRAIRFADKLQAIDSKKSYDLAGSALNEPYKISKSLIVEIADIFVRIYDPIYNLTKMANEIIPDIEKEERTFRATLTRGLKEFEKIYEEGFTDHEMSKHLQNETVFNLVTTFGFPFELVQELAQERGLIVDGDAFARSMQKHRSDSRAGSEQKFKGGLADAGETTTRLHTAHHLLLKALQTVLGEHVHQRGSNITSERLRIDFSHGEKMTEDQKKHVEEIVNEKMKENLPVITSTMALKDAEKLNAEHEFGAKYPAQVTVYSIGPIGASLENPHFENAFSIEFCGGPHVSNTSVLVSAGAFKIVKEEASSAGIRRIKAIIG